MFIHNVHTLNHESSVETTLDGPARVRARDRRGFAPTDEAKVSGADLFFDFFD
jgi:hypothetical protein